MFSAGFVGHRTLQKTASTTVFLYFACILPSIALGVLNDNNTHGKIGNYIIYFIIIIIPEAELSIIYIYHV